jgi:hypothetical protein
MAQQRAKKSLNLGNSENEYPEKPSISSKILKLVKWLDLKLGMTPDLACG